MPTPTKADFAKLGPAIKAARVRRGLTQHQLAEKVGVSYKHMANIQDGHSVPSLAVYVAICDALGMKRPELV